MGRPAGMPPASEEPNDPPGKPVGLNAGGWLPEDPRLARRDGFPPNAPGLSGGSLRSELRKAAFPPRMPPACPAGWLCS